MSTPLQKGYLSIYSHPHREHAPNSASDLNLLPILPFGFLAKPRLTVRFQKSLRKESCQYPLPCYFSDPQKPALVRMTEFPELHLACSARPCIEAFSLRCAYLRALK